jgi:membrane-associated two-gene conflict system component 1 (EACC1)
VDVSLVVSSSDRRMTSALYEWLRRENYLRGKVRLGRGPAHPEHMGDLANIITVAIGSGGLITVLVSSVTTWLSQRRNEVEIEFTSPDGKSIKVNSRGKVNAEELMKAIEASFK